MNKTRQYAIAIIIFSITSMNNKTISMDITNQTFDIEPITSKNRKKIGKKLTNHFLKNPKHPSHIKAGNIIDYLCWFMYNEEHKQYRIIEALLSNKKNLVISNKTTKNVDSFVNIEHEAHIGSHGFYRSIQINNLINFDNDQDAVNNRVKALIAKLFKNKIIDALECSDYDPKPFIYNGFTAEASYLDHFSVPYYSLTKEHFEALQLNLSV